MSYDRQIDQVCPHVVWDEPLLVETDRVTVRPLRAIASSNSVRVRLNGEVEVPPFGVASPAQSKGRKEGLFTVTPGVNDVLKVTVDQGPVQTVTLPAQNKVPVKRLVDVLNGLGLDGVTFKARKGRVTFQSGQIGPGASIRFLEGTTFADVVGITLNQEFRGQQVVPPWVLINDYNTVNINPVRLIVFDEELRSSVDHVEISYSTLRSECRRCGGTGVEHDWRYTTSGDVIAVEDEALLIQEVQKIMYTRLGSNPFHEWYGTNLLDLIGRKLSSNNFVQNMMLAESSQAFRRWQSIKRQQEDNVGQTVTDREFPFQLVAVNVTQSTQDPTVIFMKMTIQNRSNQKFDLERGLKLPEPQDLLGSTQQQGLIRQSLRDYILTE